MTNEPAYSGQTSCIVAVQTSSGRTLTTPRFPVYKSSPLVGLKTVSSRALSPRRSDRTRRNGLRLWAVSRTKRRRTSHASTSGRTTSVMKAKPMRAAFWKVIRHLLFKRSGSRGCSVA